MVQLFSKSGDPDQMPHSAASNLGLHCLLVTLLGVSRLHWVNFLSCYLILTKCTSKCMIFQDLSSQMHFSSFPFKVSVTTAAANILGPVVQSIVSLTSSLRVISLTVLAVVLTVLTQYSDVFC